MKKKKNQSPKERRIKRKKLIFILTILLIILNTINLITVLTITKDKTATGEAVNSDIGIGTICLNNPPQIVSIPDQIALIGEPFFYEVLVIDTKDSHTFYDNATMFNITFNTGTILFTPTTDQDKAANVIEGEVRTFNITAEDNSTCDNEHNDTDEFSITFIFPEEDVKQLPTPGVSGSGGGGGSPQGQVIIIPFIPEDYPVELRPGLDKAIFTIGDKANSIQVRELNADEGEFVILSALHSELNKITQRITVPMGGVGQVDLDSDGILDLQIGLVGKASNGKAQITVRSLRLGFTISEEIVKAAVKESQKLEKTIIIRNDWLTDIVVTVQNPISDLIGSFPLEFDLPKAGYQEFRLIFNRFQEATPEIYTGQLTLFSNDLVDAYTKQITTILEVESDEVLFDASLDLPEKTITIGDDLIAAVTVFNLKRSNLDNVSLTYIVSNMTGSFYYEETEIVTLEKQASFTKTIRLPPMEPGQYVLSLKVLHKDSFGTATELFTLVPGDIAVRTPGLEIPWLEILVTIGVILLITLIVYIAMKLRRRKEQKKNNNLKDALSELDSVLKTRKK